MFKSIKRQLASVAITLTLLTGMGLPTLAISAGPTEKITIAQYGHIFLYLPIYVAVDKGFFKDEGLDAKIISTGGDEKTFTAIATGNAQFGVADPTFVAIARQHGQGGKVVAGIVTRVPFQLVAFNQKIKNIKQASDFDGYTIASLPAPSTCYAVITKIMQNNGHPVKSKIVQGAFGTLSSMIRANRADIAMELEPNTSTLVSQGARIVYSTTGYFGETAFTGLTVSDAYYSQHAKEIQAAVNAIAKAMKYIHQNFSGTLSVAKQEFPEVPEPVLMSALRRLIAEGTTPQTPVINTRAWDQAITLRKEIGDLQGSGSYKENVDMSFSLAALHISKP
jgi:NitT/TauT family transport system substrate-binding protein